MDVKNESYKFEKHNLSMNINIPMVLNSKHKNDEGNTFKNIVKIATVEINKNYHSRIIEKYKCEYPANWVEAIKERFFTKKMKEKWPVKNEIIMINVEEWTDQIVAPGGFATLLVVRNYKK